MREEVKSETSLTGMMLLAMPSMPDERFAHSVIYLCSHSSEGAMGIVVNHVAENVTFSGVIEQLGIESDPSVRNVPVHVGGPVEAARGFVLHSADYVRESTLVINEQFALTATVDILRATASGRGPDRWIFALGYAGWGAGQLDSEMQGNGWLVAPADEAIVFDLEDNQKWSAGLSRIGVDPGLLSSATGRA